MAHYAEIENGLVKRVLVTSNDWTHEETLEWLVDNIAINVWVKTSYNGTIRNKFAGVGDAYLSDLDVFVENQPYPSWTFNAESLFYISPVPRPNIDKNLYWDEPSLSWKEV